MMVDFKKYKITGITTCKQMKKLAKITGTEEHFMVIGDCWTNENTYVTYSDISNVFCDWYLTVNELDALEEITWKKFKKLMKKG